MTPAGRFRDRVTLQAPAADAPDVIGQRPDLWVDVPSLAPDGAFFAEVRPLSGREAEQAKGVVAESTHKVFMRDVGVEITPRHRLIHHSRFGEKTLNVVDAPFNAAEGLWTLLCEGEA